VLHLAGATGMAGIGHISDKFSKKKILFTLIILSVLSMWGLIIFSSQKAFVLPCLIILGMLLFSSAPVILTLVQHINSRRPAFINSIYFTLGFFINTTGILLVGIAGDNIGLDMTFKICALLPLASIPFLFFLPKT
jgi:predicted MFS family arabinose efflux permease